jgi:NarL family two-component system response regulator LiaR
MVRVLLVDDHQVVRLGLRSYLETEEDITVVAEARDGHEAVELAAKLQPDVILMDLIMPNMNGIEATQKIHAADLRARVVVLTSSLDDERMIQALRAGAMSYILKTAPAEQVVSAVRKATRGESVLDGQVQQRLIGELQSVNTSKPWEDLTERERDVLKGIAAGKSNQEIGDALGIGIKTVKTHVSNIFIKIGVLDRTQAAIYAIRHHLD